MEVGSIAHNYLYIRFFRTYTQHTHLIINEMTRGRKPIPNQLKRLRGTDQPIRMRDELNIEKINKIPVPPKHFNKAARKIYKTVGDTLVSLGILTEIDFPAFVAMCDEYGTYYDLTIELKTVPTRAVMSKESAQVYKRMKAARNEAYEKFYRLSSDFGLTPAARLKFHVVKEEKSEFQQFLDEFNG